MIFNLSSGKSIVHSYLTQLRDVGVQKDSMRFRKNLERVGEVIAYEISRTLDYKNVLIDTPLATASAVTLAEHPVIITILRAGLPFFQGFLNVFDEAQSGFVGAFRDENNSNLEIKMNYLALPSIDKKPLIIADPMLATGSSLIKSIERLFAGQLPSVVHFTSVIAAPEGISNLQQFLERFPALKYNIWTASIDERLDDKFYIVPGLGDAGDLSYGEKL